MLTPADFAELKQYAAALNTKNHLRYLSEYLASLRKSRDPATAYELLDRMHRSARQDERGAILDVCKWLDTTLVRRPRRPLGDLELQIAWARRVACIAVARSKGAVHGAQPRSSDQDTRREQPPPLDGQLRTLRQKYPKPPSPPPPPLSPLFRTTTASRVATITQQAPLPDALEVMFADHRSAVNVLKQATRGASLRPLKPILLASPTGKPFPGLTDPVYLAPSAATPGLADYLKKLHGPKSGSAFPFYVTAFEYDGEQVLARAIRLTDPTDTHP